MGPSWAALLAGKSPKKMRIAAEKPISNSTTSQPTPTVYSVARFAIAAKPNVKPAPISPPTTQSKTDSTRNCSRTSDPRAPTASRIPISRILSVTETSMLFMTPMPPTTSETPALELSTWLTATLPAADKRSEIHISISADQIAANHVGAFTALPSLEPATMTQNWKENQEGLNEGYYSHCSYRSPTQVVPAEINPRNLFDRLFREPEQRGDGRESTRVNALDRSLLDIVLGGARELRRTLPSSDQRKLDEYLDSVRSVERRIAAIEYRQKEAALEKAGVRAGMRHATDSPPIEIKIPEGDQRSEYMQVMCDLNVLAFQTDTTRVSTYIGSRPNGASYPEQVGLVPSHTLELQDEPVSCGSSPVIMQASPGAQTGAPK